MIYVVRPGDYLSKIAADHGIADWHALYNDANNAEFRRLRPNPNLIYPGDRLFIPDSGEKQLPAPTGGSTRFRAHRAGDATLELTLVDFQGHPLASKTCTLEIAGAARFVTTDGSGRLREPIPRDLAQARLTVDACTMALEIGQLNPMDDADDQGCSGVQGRLANLGYFGGPIDGQQSDELRGAICAFQRDNQLAESGEISPSLKDKLRSKYGC